MSDGKPLDPWVICGPDDLYYIGLHSDELSAWTIAFGWPNDDEIRHYKASGWYAAKAEMTWRRMQQGDSDE